MSILLTDLTSARIYSNSLYYDDYVKSDDLSINWTGNNTFYNFNLKSTTGITTRLSTNNSLTTGYELILPIDTSNPTTTGNYFLSTTSTANPYQLTWTDSSSFIPDFSTLTSLVLNFTQTIDSDTTFTNTNTFSNFKLDNILLSPLSTDTTSYSIALPLEPVVTTSLFLTTTQLISSNIDLDWSDLTSTDSPSFLKLISATPQTIQSTNTWVGTNIFNNMNIGWVNIGIPTISSNYNLLFPDSATVASTGVYGLATSSTVAVDLSFNNTLNNFITKNVGSTNSILSNNTFTGVNTFNSGFKLFNNANTITIVDNTTVNGSFIFMDDSVSLTANKLYAWGVTSWDLIEGDYVSNVFGVTQTISSTNTFTGINNFNYGINLKSVSNNFVYITVGDYVYTINFTNNSLDGVLDNYVKIDSSKNVNISPFAYMKKNTITTQINTNTNTWSGLNYFDTDCLTLNEITDTYDISLNTPSSVSTNTIYNLFNNISTVTTITNPNNKEYIITLTPVTGGTFDLDLSKLSTLNNSFMSKTLTQTLSATNTWDGVNTFSNGLYIEGSSLGLLKLIGDSIPTSYAINMPVSIPTTSTNITYNYFLKITGNDLSWLEFTDFLKQENLYISNTSGDTNTISISNSFTGVNTFNNNSFVLSGGIGNGNVAVNSVITSSSNNYSLVFNDNTTPLFGNDGIYAVSTTQNNSGVINLVWEDLNDYYTLMEGSTTFLYLSSPNTNTISTESVWDGINTFSAANGSSNLFLKNTELSTFSINIKSNIIATSYTLTLPSLTSLVDGNSYFMAVTPVNGSSVYDLNWELSLSSTWVDLSTSQTISSTNNWSGVNNFAIDSFKIGHINLNNANTSNDVYSYVLPTAASNPTASGNYMIYINKTNSLSASSYQLNWLASTNYPLLFLDNVITDIIYTDTIWTNTNNFNYGKFVIGSLTLNSNSSSTDDIELVLPINYPTSTGIYALSSTSTSTPISLDWSDLNSYYLISGVSGVDANYMKNTGTNTNAATNTWTGVNTFDSGSGSGILKVSNVLGTTLTFNTSNTTSNYSMSIYSLFVDLSVLDTTFIKKTGSNTITATNTFSGVNIFESSGIDVGGIYLNYSSSTTNDSVLSLMPDLSGITSTNGVLYSISLGGTNPYTTSWIDLSPYLKYSIANSTYINKSITGANTLSGTNTWSGINTFRNGVNINGATFGLSSTITNTYTLNLKDTITTTNSTNVLSLTNTANDGINYDLDWYNLYNSFMLFTGTNTVLSTNTFSGANQFNTDKFVISNVSSGGSGGTVILNAPSTTFTNYSITLDGNITGNNSGNAIYMFSTTSTSATNTAITWINSTSIVPTTLLSLTANQIIASTNTLTGINTFSSNIYLAGGSGGSITGAINISESQAESYILNFDTFANQPTTNGTYLMSLDSVNNTLTWTNLNTINFAFMKTSLVSGSQTCSATNTFTGVNTFQGDSLLSLYSTVGGGSVTITPSSSTVGSYTLVLPVGNTVAGNLLVTTSTSSPYVLSWYDPSSSLLLLSGATQTNAGTNTWTGVNTFADSTFTLKGTGGGNLVINAPSTLTSSNNYVLTLPSTNTILATPSTSVTLVTTNTFSPYSLAWQDLISGYVALSGTQTIATSTTFTGPNTFLSGNLKMVYSTGSGSVSLISPNNTTNFNVYLDQKPIILSGVYSLYYIYYGTNSYYLSFTYLTNYINTLSTMNGTPTNYMRPASGITQTTASVNTLTGSNIYSSTSLFLAGSSGTAAGTISLSAPALTSLENYTLTLPTYASNPTTVGTYLLYTTSLASPYQLNWYSLALYFSLLNTQTISAVNTWTSTNIFSNNCLTVSGASGTAAGKVTLTAPVLDLVDSYTMTFPSSAPTVSSQYILTTTSTTSPYELTWFDYSTFITNLGILAVYGTNANISANNTWSGTNTYANNAFSLNGGGTGSLSLNAPTLATSYNFVLPDPSTATSGLYFINTASRSTPYTLSWNSISYVTGLTGKLQFTGSNTNTGIYTYSGVNTFENNQFRIKGTGAGIVTLTGPTSTDSYSMSMPSTGPSSGSNVNSLSTTAITSPYNMSWYDLTSNLINLSSSYSGTVSATNYWNGTNTFSNGILRTRYNANSGTYMSIFNGCTTMNVVFNLPDPSVLPTLFTSNPSAIIAITTDNTTASGNTTFDTYFMDLTTELNGNNYIQPVDNAITVTNNINFTANNYFKFDCFCLGDSSYLNTLSLTNKNSSNYTLIFPTTNPSSEGTYMFSTSNTFSPYPTAWINQTSYTYEAGNTTGLASNTQTWSGTNTFKNKATFNTLILNNGNSTTTPVTAENLRFYPGTLSGMGGNYRQNISTQHDSTVNNNYMAFWVNTGSSASTSNGSGNRIGAYFSYGYGLNIPYINEGTTFTGYKLQYITSDGYFSNMGADAPKFLLPNAGSTIRCTPNTTNVEKITFWENNANLTSTGTGSGCISLGTSDNMIFSSSIVFSAGVDYLWCYNTRGQSTANKIVNLVGRSNYIQWLMPSVTSGSDPDLPKMSIYRSSGVANTSCILSLMSKTTNNSLLPQNSISFSGTNITGVYHAGIGLQIGGGMAYNIWGIYNTVSNKGVYYSSTGTVGTLSDNRLKNVVGDLTCATEKIRKIRPIYYKWKEQPDYDKDVKIGVLAQDVLAVLPEIVSQKDTEDKDKDYYGVAYSLLLVLVLAVIRESAARLEKLRENYENNKLKIEEMKKKIAQRALMLETMKTFVDSVRV